MNNLSLINQSVGSFIMAALKSKVELFHWYQELKTEFKTGKITVFEFERQVLSEILSLTDTGKTPSTAKISLVVDILNSVVFDHVFTADGIIDLDNMLAREHVRNISELTAARNNFITIQAQARLNKEKEQTAKPAEQKAFAKFPTKEELEYWVNARKLFRYGNPNTLGTEAYQEVVKYWHLVDKYLGTLKLELDHTDPNYVDNILLIDYFVSLVAKQEVPEEERRHLKDTLSSLYACPIKTPHIDAFVERGQHPLPVKPKQPPIAQQAIDRAIAWREEETKTNHQQKDILREFADQYCPVMVAKQHATQQLFDFVARAVKRVLTAIAQPNNPEDAEMLAKGHAINILNVKHGVIGVSTTITRNGLVKLRIFAERELCNEDYGIPTLSYNQVRQSPHATFSIPVPALIDGFINMWDIPNQAPRHMHNSVGGMLGNPYPLQQLDGLMSAIAREAAEYGVTPTYGSTEDSLIVVLH
ncbi:hypothetical protein SPECIALG_72 [Erwinia phage vB_EamM_Special G]|uniref:Uncharacterized protein n=2 Tax=Agricanvirus TaxID=1984776 RepID=A0A191ZBX0_9CAUD|nr:hypothetical protein FDI00_gp072 [Erwinia phage vB_EamM_Special G]ANJ64882.1 hypothetical protein SPECIALG_72 [Erwinia phage vB_EamM_Special G]